MCSRVRVFVCSPVQTCAALHANSEIACILRYCFARLLCALRRTTAAGRDKALKLIACFCEIYTESSILLGPHRFRRCVVAFAFAFCRLLCTPSASSSAVGMNPFALHLFTLMRTVYDFLARKHDSFASAAPLCFALRVWQALKVFNNFCAAVKLMAQQDVR